VPFLGITQLYFDDSIPDRIYTTVPPYTQRGARNVDNDGDGIFRPDLVLSVRQPYAGLVIGVRGI
jgi:hypothetical protein